MTCPNCGIDVHPDEIIYEQKGIGQDTEWLEKCEYCIDD